MGNIIWSEEIQTHSKKILGPAPCFPNTCEKHIQTGIENSCKECMVFKWYAEQERALQELAQHKLKSVKEQTKNNHLDKTIKLVETSLDYMNEN